MSTTHIYCDGCKRFTSPFFRDIIGWGIVLTDAGGNYVSQLAGTNQGKSSNEAELEAVRQAILWWQANGQPSCVIFSDSLHRPEISALISIYPSIDFRQIDQKRAPRAYHQAHDVAHNALKRAHGAFQRSNSAHA